jgi:prolyl 4-hydroxylase
MTSTSPAIAATRALLVGEGRPADPALLDQAAEAGDADAANLLATLYTSGAWASQDWNHGLDLLQRAAEGGSASAQGQLRLLAPDQKDWASRRRAVDVSAWLTPPSRRNLCESPRVRQCDAFVSPAVCDWLVGLAQGRVRPAMMVEGYGASPRFTTDRTNSDFAFTAFDADCVLALVRARISALLQLPVGAMEPPQVFHYAVGQELRPHVDYLQREGREAGAYQGDRIATFLIYLNDDFQGGETWFSRVDLKARPAKGGAVYFANVDPNGRPDPMSLHAGLPPTRGEKWLFSQWIHDRPFVG